MIQVIGVLVNPINEPIQTNIRVTAENSETTLISAEANKITGEDGSYDFTLVEGSYCIDLLIDDEYSKCTYITVDGLTPTPIELPTLLTNHITVEAI